jgi:hypothetical protein
MPVNMTVNMRWEMWTYTLATNGSRWFERFSTVESSEFVGFLRHVEPLEKEMNIPEVRLCA